MSQTQEPVNLDSEDAVASWLQRTLNLDIKTHGFPYGSRKEGGAWLLYPMPLKPVLGALSFIVAVDGSLVRTIGSSVYIPHEEIHILMESGKWKTDDRLLTLRLRNPQELEKTPTNRWWKRLWPGQRQTSGSRAP